MAGEPFTGTVSNSEIDSLNEAFALEGMLEFHAGPGGLTFAILTTPLSTADVCLHGAHVTSFLPTAGSEVLWLSSQTAWQEGKAIRGGIPVCWPWFADHPTDSSLPAHGIARTAMWDVVRAWSPFAGCIRLELFLPTSSVSKEHFDAEFDLRLEITLQDSLKLELTAINRSDRALQVTDALHTYLTVGDIEAVRCRGLDGVTYFDKVDGLQRKIQAGDVTFSERTDRIYEQTADDVLLRDEALDRSIRIKKSGSITTVVWNPWSELSEKMTDMAADGYRTMVCVEAANAGADVILLEPADKHVLSTTLCVE